MSFGHGNRYWGIYGITWSTKDFPFLFSFALLGGTENGKKRSHRNRTTGTSNGICKDTLVHAFLSRFLFPYFSSVISLPHLSFFRCLLPLFPNLVLLMSKVRWTAICYTCVDSRHVTCGGIRLSAVGRFGTRAWPGDDR